MKRHLKPIFSALLLTALAGGSAFAAVQTITYNDFSDLSGLTLNGNTASINSGAGVTFGGQKVLRLTSSAPAESGSAFLTNSIPLQDSGGKTSFSTEFQFQITNPGGIGDEDGQGADGLCFVVQTVANTAGGGGGGIGYENIANSLGIEFDTYNNGSGVGDPNGNHAGIDLNGSVNSVATTLEPTRFNDGNIWTAWVDYNGATSGLEVRWNQTGIRPLASMLSYTTDLSAVLGQSNAFVGFTSGTGSGYGDHDIRNWTFTNTYQPITGQVPEPASFSLLLAGIPGLLALRRKR